jgi:CRP/FNR family transcriptional regulator
MMTPVLAPFESSVRVDRPAVHRSHRAPAAERGRLRDLVALLGLGDEALQTIDPSISVALWHVYQGGGLLLEGELATTLYVVRTGSLKSMKTLEDGYEQVLSLALPGELLGSEALHEGHQPATVVALQDTTVHALPLCELRQLCLQCPVLDRALQRALSRQLVRAAEVTAMNAAVSSDVRLARFLLWLSARMADIGQSSHRILLRLGRRDIASLLCVAHETVSRGFTTLAEAGYLAIDRKEVEILDMARLRQFSRCTRGGPQESAHGTRGVEVARCVAATAWDASLETALTTD